MSFTNWVVKIFDALTTVFEGRLRDRVQATMDSAWTRSGEIEHQFFGFGAGVLLFIEMKYNIRPGPDHIRKMYAQIMAESAGMVSNDVL